MKPLSERIKIEKHFAEGGDVEMIKPDDAHDQWDVLLPHDRNAVVFHWDVYDYRIHYPKPEGEGWIRWEGGECPVDYFTDVEFMLRNGWISSDKAGRGNWKHFGIKYDNIIWYRVPKRKVTLYLYKDEIDGRIWGDESSAKPEISNPVLDESGNHRTIEVEM